MNNTEDVLQELANFIAVHGINFVKSSVDNKLTVSIYNKHGLYDDYEFTEDITSDQIVDRQYVKL